MQCVQRALHKLETGGERKEGLFARAKLAKIFIRLRLIGFSVELLFVFIHKQCSGLN